MNRQTRGLGRGLGALLAAEGAEPDALTEIAIEQISPNPHQPRKDFKIETLDELAASIKATGIIQPLVVRRVQGGYELIAGERRWRAARQVGLERVPAVVREATDAESLEIALVENLLREDLNPMEEAEAYQRLLAQFGWTQEALAQRLGRDRSSITNVLRLLRLPELIQADLRAGRLTMGHARALLAVPDPEQQLKLREEILAHSWSVRAAEDSARAATAPARLTGKPGRRRSPELTALEAALQRALLTRVRITGTDRRGRIEIIYATAEELERLAGLLGAAH